MGDYFSEYQSFVGAKGLPTPTDTPYETPGYLRSKRASRATQGSSREASASPPPLPPDSTEYNDKPRGEGRYSALDPRRFTPTLHASLVSEILTLRRELDSKNNLVENLETSLSGARHDYDILNDELSTKARETRLAKQRVDRLEKSADEIVTELTRERDAVQGTVEDLKGKFDIVQKKARRQEEDAVRTQAIWEQDKEKWDDERRQLERRVHVTESRLRSFVDEMTSQQTLTEQQLAQKDADDDGETFKDSGMGAESDTTSVRSTTTGTKHRRNMSSLSYRSRSLRTSFSPRKSTGTPDLHTKNEGYNLADELGIDEEDEFDLDEFDHADDEIDYPTPTKRHTRSWSNQSRSDSDRKAKRILGISSEATESPAQDGQPPNASQGLAPMPTLSEAATIVPKIQYVDTGYQPSPPQSPPRDTVKDEAVVIPEIKEPATADAGSNDLDGGVARQEQGLSLAAKLNNSPISPPQTPVITQGGWPDDSQADTPSSGAYISASTQTETAVPQIVEPSTPKLNSLSPPSFVPSIAIHPPSSRPSSPRNYVLPPGTRNAATQASLAWGSTDASTQTEGIRVDKRGFQMSPPLQSLQTSSLLPSPDFEEPPKAPTPRTATGGTAKIFGNTGRSHNTPRSSSQSPTESSRRKSSPTKSSPPKARSQGSRDLKMPLRPLPLPRPILSPPADQMSPTEETKQDEIEGPLNRGSQYGVTKPSQASSHLAGLGDESDESDYDDLMSEGEARDLASSVPAMSRPHGRFGLSEPPKAVPEDKEISPERRPGTSGSAVAAPAPSISSSRATSSHRNRGKPPAKLSSYSLHSRNPSVGSVGSSTYSGTSAMPPFPIPTRSSSRALPNTHSEGSASPTPYHSDTYSQRRTRGGRVPPVTQAKLRKVQSVAVIRPRSSRSSPKKHRRRRHSPDLAPIQSMAFESPQTNFPIPDLPTPLQQQGLSSDYLGGSGDFSKPPATADSAMSSANADNGLVDAIAATMVGEWMFKYIRKRKSFGVGEDESLKPGENGTVDITGKGVRHRRWVWLSPYERTIMWDNKQPANGAALLGKKGRKLAIQSVMDVQDNTPMPKEAKVEVPFNRSILVLTPQRALKFTAPNSERHALWMTALTFLAESDARPLTPANHLQPSKPSLEPEMPTPPPIRMPQHEPPPPPKTDMTRFGRAKIRDSVRVANNRRPSFQKSMSDQPAPAPSIWHPNNPPNDNALDSPALRVDNAQVDDDDDGGAAFPAIPRLYSNTTRHHQRKRSNTSPRLPQPLMSNLRSFSSGAVPSSSSNSSAAANAARNARIPPRADVYTHKPPSSYARPHEQQQQQQQQHQQQQPPYNFFEAVGTVRMQAFVDPSVRDGVQYVPAPPPPPLVGSVSGIGLVAGVSGIGGGGGGVGGSAGVSGSTRPRRGRGDSGVSSSASLSTADKRRTGWVFDEEGRDPFRGF